MTSIKNPLTRTSPLACLPPLRVSTPLKPALATFQPILPNIPPSTILTTNQPKKRVRFALQLDSLEEDLSPSVDEERSPTFITDFNKRTNDPWRSNGPLYGAYTEYLEKKDAFSPELYRPETPEPEQESSTYTHTFLIQSKSPEIVVDSITVSASSPHLPRIIHRSKALKAAIRKSPSPAVDAYFKQRTHAGTPPRPIQTRKITNTISSRNPIIKRSDLGLPSIKSPNSSEKIIRTDRSPGTKFVNEYLQSKKLTEIIANPLPGTNNQLNYICGQSILPNLSKSPPLSYQNQITNEPYFFQNHTNDHFQPIIHSTH